MLTVTDLFCGAGGSTTGAVQVPGVTVRMAANHWPLAVDTHNTNHPDTDHDCADLSQIQPGRYPRTDILWASPECTNHSQAKGRKRNADAAPDLFGDTLPDAAAERSRATMWDVVRFAEHHRYAAIVVENVVDAAKWVLWPSWRAALDSLGYCVHVVYLNSMHARAAGLPAPQSRDRLYVVAHLRPTRGRQGRPGGSGPAGSRCPDLDQWTRPRAWCPTCDRAVRAMQAWKKPDKPWGRYRAQYVWRCPNVACRNQTVEPGWLPAAAAIDWSLPGERIGDRARPLAAKTLARIRAGIERHWRSWGPFTLEAAGNTFERRLGVRTWPVHEPLRTLHTTASKALLVPMEGRDGKAATSSSQTLRTMTTRNETGMLVPAGGTWNQTATALDQAMRTRTTRDSEAVVTPPPATAPPAPAPSPLLVPLRNNNTTKPAAQPFDTFAAAGNHHGLLMPYYGHTGRSAVRLTSQAHGTLTTRDRYALIMRNNGSRYSGAEMCTPVNEALRTLTTAGHQSVVEIDPDAAHPAPDEAPDRAPDLLPIAVEDCLFRMLEPHEVAAAMAFGAGYIVLGNKREKVRQLGNAVTPPAARDLIAAIAESLGHDLTDLTHGMGDAA